MDDQSKPPSSSSSRRARTIALRSRIARWPWWLLIIIIALAATFYTMATNGLYRRAFAAITSSPKLTTNEFADVSYIVRTPDGKTSEVRGALRSDTATDVTVVTTPELHYTIPREDIVTITCDTPDPGGNCPINKTASVTRGSISGGLVVEDLGVFQIQTPWEDSINIYKIDVVTRPGTPQECSDRNKAAGCQVPDQVRTPADCAASLSATCHIMIKLKPDDPNNKITGLLTDSDSATVTVQVSPEVTQTIQKADIVDTRNVNYNSVYCAFNNLKACNDGIFLTIGVTLGAFALAVVLGLIFGLMRVSDNVVLYQFSTMYVEVMRGVPLLVILLFVFFVFVPWFRDNFPSYAPQVALVIGVAGVSLALYYLVSRWSRRRTEPFELIQPVALTIISVVTLELVIYFFGIHSGLNEVQASILGLAIGYGAFLAELFRAGIQSIGHGQMEAARSLGMTYPQAMRYIILPQAFRVVLPPLGNDFIAMLKDTSLVAVLAVNELTQKSRLFATKYFVPFPAYITIGVIYLCTTLILSFLVRRLEQRINVHRQQAR